MDRPPEKENGDSQMPAAGARSARKVTHILASHELRLRIFQLAISREQISPKDAAIALSEPISDLAYHFRVLARHGAIELVRLVPVRGSNQHFYAPYPDVVQMPIVQHLLASAEAGEL